MHEKTQSLINTALVWRKIINWESGRSTGKATCLTCSWAEKCPGLEARLNCNDLFLPKSFVVGRIMSSQKDVHVLIPGTGSNWFRLKHIVTDCNLIQSEAVSIYNNPGAWEYATLYSRN